MTDSPLTIVIVGGVAGGASAATRARRLNEGAEIILFEKDEYVSFANCGLPYCLGRDIADRSKLLVATADFLRRRFRLDVRTRQEVTGIDRTNRTVTVKNHADGTTYEQRYSKLILAPGASPIVPPIKGADAPNALTLRNLHDMDRIDAAVQSARTKKAVVVGAGFIGLEMVEQLTRRGLEVSFVELQPQVLPLFDREMAQPLREELQRHHVQLHVGTALKRIVTDRDGVAVAVELDNGQQFDTSLVILGIGVRPNHQLAREAGLRRVRTAGSSRTGTCRRTIRPFTRSGTWSNTCSARPKEPLRIPLAGPANRAGRLAGEHAVTDAAHPMADVMGTAIVRVFDLSAAQTGLSTARARQLGIPARSVTVVANNHAGYYPGATPITLKLVFDPKYGRVLGAQAVGRDGVDKRIDVIATAMSLERHGLGSGRLGPELRSTVRRGQGSGTYGGFRGLQSNGRDHRFPGCGRGPERHAGARCSHAAGGAAAATSGAENVINIPLDELRDRLHELDNSRETAVTCQSELAGARSILPVAASRLRTGSRRVRRRAGPQSSVGERLGRPEAGASSWAEDRRSNIGTSNIEWDTGGGRRLASLFHTSTCVQRVLDVTQSLSREAATLCQPRANAALPYASS